jgi:hypothetical protein
MFYKTRSLYSESVFRHSARGFYFKPGIFLVQLDSAGRLSTLVTPLGLRGFQYQESDGPYTAIARAPKSQSGELELRLFSEDGGCTQIAVSGNGQGLCDDPRPSGFTPDEIASRTPLKTQLAKIARLAAPNVYRIADAGKSHRDFYAIYRQERLIFIGNAQPRLSPQTKILGYQRRKDQWAEAEFGSLELEGDYIRYELASTGYIVSGSAKQLNEIPSDLTPDQRFTETESSGFQVGGVNSNEVIGRMTSLTSKPS